MIQLNAFNFNKNVLDIQSSPIRRFNNTISEIDGLIKLTLGQPDYNAPEYVHEAAIQAIRNKKDGYTESKGLLDLRERVSSYIKRKYNLDYDADTEIVINHGATGALFSSLFALVDSKDKVLVPSPYYPIYKNIIEMADAEIVLADVSDDNFILTGERFLEYYKKHPEMKVLLLNYPSNPTGATYTEEELKELADAIRQTDVAVVSDEIYAELTYEDSHVSIASFLPERTLMINGLTKSHAMTGWRMAFTAGPEVFMSEVAKVAQATTNTPNTIAQYASIAAYSEESDQAVSEMKTEYRIRRDYLKEELAKLGYEIVHPDGAFYLFVRVPSWYEGDDEQFCLDLAHQAKIGVIPGSAFGEAGEGYFRISYASSREELKAFIERIASFTKEKER